MQHIPATPVLRARVRNNSGGEANCTLKPSPKVPLPKLTLERELEILEKLQNRDYDTSAGPEQWFPPPVHPSIKLHQHNLIKMNGLFGSVPINLGKTKTYTAAMQQNFNRDRGVTLSDSDINLDNDQNCKRKLFGKTGVVSTSTGSYSASVFSSPTDSTESYNEEILEEVEDIAHKNFEAYVAAVDKRNKARRLLLKKRNDNGEMASALQSYDFDGLIRKINAINISFEKLKMQDRLGSIDINKLYPSFEKTTYFLPCPIEEQLGILNGLLSTSDLYQFLSKLENEKLDCSENNIKEKLSSLEKRVNDLEKLINIEEKETREMKQQLAMKTNGFTAEEINGCDSNCSEEGVSQDTFSTEECAGYYEQEGYDDKSF